MKSLLVALSLFTFVISVSYSQTVNTKKLDSLFDALEKRGLASGSIAILVNGKTAYQRTAGFAVIDKNKKVAPDGSTKYRIGSISKMFTAVIIFQLVEEGKLKLTDKLAIHFPQLPNAGNITIENMMYHRSGLPDYTRDTNFPEWMDKPKTQEEMLKIVAGKAPDFEPNTKADYCNTNYLLLSYIIEKVENRQFAQSIEKRITSRIALKNTYYGKPIDIRRNDARSYKYSDGTWNKEKETDMSIHGGAGSIVSTPKDLASFIQNLFSGNLISHASIVSMKKILDGYGMGLFPFDFGTAKGYGHNGRIEEFYSAVRYYPEKKLALSYITNGILYPRIDLMDGVLNICFNIAYSIPFSQPVVLQDRELDQYTGIYSSGSLPFKVACKKNDKKIIFEAAGKTMEAEPISSNYFMNLKSGSFFVFNPEKGELQIKETDNVYYLQKQK